MMPVVTSYAAFKRMGDDARAQYLAERRELGMTDVQIFREAGFNAQERKKAYKFLWNRGQAIPDPACKVSSLCWSCKRSLCGCSWSQSFVPVEGWTAQASETYKDGYLVLSCPLFIKA